jgi:hypothetical protein
MTPEVRLSPDKQDAAIRNGSSPWAPWRVTSGGWFSDEHVADWTPLLPAPSEDGAA